MVACTISRTSSRRHSQSMSFSTMRPTRSSSPTTTCQSGAPRSTVSPSRLELSLQQSKEALPLPPLPQVPVWRVLLRTVQGFDGRDARKAEIGGAGADRQPQGRAADHQGDFGRPQGETLRCALDGWCPPSRAVRVGAPLVLTSPALRHSFVCSQVDLGRTSTWRSERPSRAHEAVGSLACVLLLHTRCAVPLQTRRDAGGRGSPGDAGMIVYA